MNTLKKLKTKFFAPSQWIILHFQNQSFLIQNRESQKLQILNGTLEQMAQVASQKGLEYTPNLVIDFNTSFLWMWDIQDDSEDHSLSWQYKEHLWAKTTFDSLLHKTLSLPTPLQSIAEYLPWPLFLEIFALNQIQSEYALVSFKFDTQLNTQWILYFRNHILADAHCIRSTLYTPQQIQDHYIQNHIATKWMDDLNNEHFEVINLNLKTSDLIHQVIQSPQWQQHINTPSKQKHSIWTYNESAYQSVLKQKKWFVKSLTFSFLLLFLCIFLFGLFHASHFALQFYQKEFQSSYLNKYYTLKEGLNQREQLTSELSEYLNLLKQRTPHAQILKQTQNALPSNVWLLSWQIIELKQTLKGQTLSESALNAFLKNLEAQFELVQLKTRTQKGNAINFEIEIGKPSALNTSTAPQSSKNTL